MQGGGGPNPTFSSSEHFSSIHILNIDLSLGYPPPQLLWEQVTNGSEAKWMLRSLHPKAFELKN